MRLALGIFLGLFSSARAEESAPPHKMAIGVTYLGGQVRYHLNPRWAAELRYLTGTISDPAGYATSHVAGLRGLRFFKAVGAYRPYLGAEAALINSSGNETGIFYKAAGFAGGGFGGMEYAFAKRLALSLDIGPYVMRVKERDAKTTSTSLEFVANASLNFYLY